jgi:hypothetical protein
MTAHNEQSLLLDGLLRPLWVTVCVCMLSVFGVYLWTPDVAPIVPARASLVFEPESWEDPATVQSGDAFIAKPLFMTDRRPHYLNDLVSAATPSVVAQEDINVVIEGVNLLGVFSSAGKAGVIVEEKDFGQSRLLKGEGLHGWTLIGVESRAAVFSDGRRTTRVNMAVVSQSQAPNSRTQTRDELLPDFADDAQTESSADKPKFVPTFDAIYQDKVRSEKSISQVNDSQSGLAEEGGEDDGE